MTRSVCVELTADAEYQAKKAHKAIDLTIGRLHNFTISSSPCGAVKRVAFVLKFAEDAVHDPVCWCCTDGCGFAGGNASKVFYDGLDDGQLHVVRIFQGNFLFSAVGDKTDGSIIVNGKPQEPFVACDLNDIFLCVGCGDEVPETSAYQTILELETGADSVFCSIAMSTICMVTVGLDNDAKDVLQEVELVGSEVIEIASSRNVWL